MELSTSSFYYFFLYIYYLKIHLGLRQTQKTPRLGSASSYLVLFALEIGKDMGLLITQTQCIGVNHCD